MNSIISTIMSWENVENAVLLDASGDSFFSMTQNRKTDKHILEENLLLLNFIAANKIEHKCKWQNICWHFSNRHFLLLNFDTDHLILTLKKKPDIDYLSDKIALLLKDRQ